MINVMEIAGQKAVIVYDPEINMFRGEFLGLSGGADFYATDVAGLFREGETSLRVYLDMCRERGVEPYRRFSGRLNVRLDEATHERATIAAAARGQSLNQFIANAVEHEVADLA